jgi:hypothetical protein
MGEACTTNPNAFQEIVIEDDALNDLRLLSIDSISKLIGPVSTRTLTRWVVNKVFPQPDFWFKGRRFWRLSTLIAWEKTLPTECDQECGIVKAGLTKKDSTTS